ncbi:MAG TPA: hypothetical protein VG015_00150, partial [Candidatus Dormibacteraeota bacterium]|jgi:hypothetical protein|nr:hypothetical protein [Candidatus Dormibacteraeota bacterium]
MSELDPLESRLGDLFDQMEARPGYQAQLWDRIQGREFHQRWTGSRMAVWGAIAAVVLVVGGVGVMREVSPQSPPGQMRALPAAAPADRAVTSPPFDAVAPAVGSSQTNLCLPIASAAQSPQPSPRPSGVSSPVICPTPTGK